MFTRHLNTTELRKKQFTIFERNIWMTLFFLVESVSAVCTFYVKFCFIRTCLAMLANAQPQINRIIYTHVVNLRVRITCVWFFSSLCASSHTLFSCLHELYENCAYLLPWHAHRGWRRQCFAPYTSPDSNIVGISCCTCCRQGLDLIKTGKFLFF